MSEFTMDDLLDECLFNKPKKNKKKRKEIKETVVDVKKILGEAEDKGAEEDVEEASTLDAKDATASKSKDDAEKKDAKGELVMTVSMKISDVDQGDLEIGEEEYASITNINSILSLYDISTKNLVDPNKATDTLSITVEEEVSNSDKNNISMVMRSNVDGTMSINVLVNELGQTFDNIDSAIQYFDRQYQNNILNIINKEVRG